MQHVAINKVHTMHIIGYIQQETTMFIEHHVHRQIGLISTSVQITIVRIMHITTTIATNIAAIPLKITKRYIPSPAIEEFQKTSIIISPTVQNGQRINTNGKNIIVRTI